MKDRIRNFLIGRQGMDEFSKFLFWSALSCIVIGALFYAVGLRIFSRLAEWLFIFQFIMCFVRAFSRNLPQRELENRLYLAKRAQFADRLRARRERFGQRKNYKFFKCPGCGKWLRVPRGKGRIHINCRCGYTLYRKT